MEVPTFLSYSLERRLSKHRSELGSGAIEGVAGPEAANNAAAAGVLVPLLTIGLPTSATAAVILTAFQPVLRPAARTAAVLRVRTAGVGAGHGCSPSRPTRSTPASWCSAPSAPLRRAARSPSGAINIVLWSVVALALLLSAVLALRVRRVRA